MPPFQMSTISTGASARPRRSIDQSSASRPRESIHGRFTRQHVGLTFFEQGTLSTLCCEIFRARYRSCIWSCTVLSKSALMHAVAGEPEAPVTLKTTLHATLPLISRKSPVRSNREHYLRLLK